MTRKDYVMLAAVMLDQKPTAETVKYQAWENCCQAIAEALKDDNQCFDKARFLKACGVSC